jgi:hypothetical protein
MRNHILRTIAFAALSLGLAATVSAQDHRCSNPGLVGTWGYTETGTVVVPSPTGPVQVVAAAVGKYEFDFAGNFSGTQNSSAGGTVSQDLKLGTFTENADCTGTLTIHIYDPSGTTLRRTSVWAIVLVDNATEFRGIMTSMVLPNGVNLSPIMTMSAKRLVRDQGQEQ